MVVSRHSHSEGPECDPWLNLHGHFSAHMLNFHPQTKKKFWECKEYQPPPLGSELTSCYGAHLPGASVIGGNKICPTGAIPLSEMISTPLPAWARTREVHTDTKRRHYKLKVFTGCLHPSNKTCYNIHNLNII
jgi:hypothetical protein